MDAGETVLTARAWRGLDGLVSALADWRAVMELASVDPLCNGPQWVHAYARCFVEPSSIFGWTLVDAEGRPRAILPFRREPSRGIGRLRRAIHLADGTFDSDYLAFPSVGLDPRVLTETALDLLAKERSIDVAILSCMKPDSPLVGALREWASSRGYARREIGVACFAMSLPDSFEGYLKVLKPRVRSKIRQALRLAEEAGAKFLWCDDPNALEGHVEGLFTLHTQRWQAVGNRGAFWDPRRRAFFHQLSADFLPIGRLRFARVELGGKAVAYQHGVLAGGTYYQLQEGFDPQFEKQRIATALRAWMVARLIEQGVTHYDFMAGESQHKEEWGGRALSCATIAVPLPKWRARLAYRARAIADRIRPRKGSHAPPVPGGVPDAIPDAGKALPSDDAD